MFAERERLGLAEWAERRRRWPNRGLYDYDVVPHLRAVVDAYEDPAIEEITVVKPSQTGFTEGLIVNALGYHIDCEPHDVMVVQPTLSQAEKFSKGKLHKFFEANPRIAGRISASDTLVEKAYPGGKISLVGARSARAFRMDTIGRVFGDDVDGWDATAGQGASDEGDQVTLIRRRTDRIEDRKLVWISTPTRNGTRIIRLYEQMDRRGEFHVPCPHCGTMQVLEWGRLAWESEEVEPGYQKQPGEVLRGSTVHRPDTAHYICVNDCRIEESDKRWMEEHGDYLAEDGEPVRQDGVRTVGFWLRGALTITLPGSEWPRLIREFLDVKDHPDALRGFVNLVLGEEFDELGDAPEWERIYERREGWPVGLCPEGVEFLTAGADVQDDRIEVSVWGWAPNKESWWVDHRIVAGDPSQRETWDDVTEILHASWPTESGGALPIARFGIDTGHDQASVVDWARRVGDRRVMLIKGDPWKNWRVMVGTPSRSDTNFIGKKYGLQLWTIGGALIKQETYGFLRLPMPRDGEPFPPGYIHIPKVDEELVKQLVAEDLVTSTDRRGFTKREWVKRRHRNEALDCRVYARAAAEQLGLSRMAALEAAGGQAGGEPRRASRARDAEGDGRSRRGGWLGRGGSARRRGGR
ncbi:MAG: phage terminase large subunit family protein, partial [Gemmatimonadota bacterium]